jgi:ParB-like chromosome segregation protein Spo0J
VQRAAEALPTLKVEYVPIDSVFPNEYNPDRQSEHDFELLCRSVEENGFTTPIVRDGRKIADGEHRWRAAHVLGYQEIPVVFYRLDPGASAHLHRSA